MQGDGVVPSGRHSNRHGGRHSSGTPAVAPVWRHPLGTATKVVSALVSLALLLGFGYGWWSYRDLNGHLKRLEVFNSATKAQHDIDGKDQNILVVGNDDRTDMTDREVKELKVGRDGGSLNTDTMMIVHVPGDGSRATLISLPRDAYVQIPGYGMAKLNSAYSDGYLHSSGTPDQQKTAGASLLIETIQSLTGLQIDHYVQVSLVGFVRISDAIGGVTVNLCNAVDDPQYSHLVISAGKHSIKGVTALEFVRQRHGLTLGDIDREARQRYFLTAAFRKIASAGTLLDPARLHSLIGAIDKSIYVDPGFDILKLAQQVSGLNADNIQGKNIPYVRFDTVDPVGSVEIIDPGQVQQWVRNLLGEGQAALGSVAAADPSAVTVRVLNGGTVNGAAGTNATRLRGYGFTTTSGNHAPQPATTVEYADGMQSQVKALLKYLPANVVLQQSAVPVLTLVLGADGLAVKKPGTSSAQATSIPKPKPIDARCIN
jgi:LCP family protein required for cell wall assembly